MNLWAELKRRNVVRVALFYIVAAWLLVQVAETVLPLFEVPAGVLRGLVILLALGFVPAVIVSWVYELTPEGVKRDAEVEVSEQTRQGSARKLNLVTLVIALLAIGLLVLDRALLDSARPAVTTPVQQFATGDAAPVVPRASIAVLPFADLSPDSDQEYFSDGMDEEILNALVRVRGLQVASRTSSFGFKGQESLGIPAIAGELGVRHVLEGSVRRAGDALRITAQLIDAEVDRHLWSETLDRPLTVENVFAIQDEIAGAIVSALVNSLGIEVGEQPRLAPVTENLTAYDLYLRARAHFQARSGLDAADELLRRAVEQDPDFVKAWELHATLQTLMRGYGYSQLSQDEHDRLGMAYAEQALSLEPDSPMALASLAFMRFLATTQLRQRHEFSAIIRDLERAVAIDPHRPSAHNWLGLALSAVGRLEDALAAFAGCMEIDPLFAPCAENEYTTMDALGRHEQAYAKLMAALDRGTVTNQYFNFQLLARLGERTAFLTAANQSNWLPGWRRHAEIYDAYQDLDRDHSALAAFAGDALETRTYLSELLIPLGAYDLLPPGPLLVWVDAYSSYRQSPQFRQLMRDSGVLAYWQAQGFPAQCRPRGAVDVACD